MRAKWAPADPRVPPAACAYRLLVFQLVGEAARHWSAGARAGDRAGAAAGLAGPAQRPFTELCCTTGGLLQHLFNRSSMPAGTGVMLHIGRIGGGTPIDNWRW